MNIISPLVSLYDRKTRIWSTPNTVPTSEAAIRGFIDAVNSGKTDNDLVNHPDDFTLYELGTFNSANGLITV